MTNIHVIDYISNARTPEEAEVFMQAVIPHLDNDQNLIIDFAGIQNYSHIFFDNSFDKLAHRYGIYKILNIRTINMTVQGRIAYLSSMDETERILKNMKKQQ